MVMNNIPLLLVISGPSGVGKDAIIARLCRKNSGIKYIVTATTRKKRPNEIDKKHYHFIDRIKFDKMKESDELLEWAQVYGNYYGVPGNDVKKALQDYNTVIIKVDVQGAITLKKKIPAAIFIFLMPPSEAELHNRLITRGDMDKDDLAHRLDIARHEMQKIHEFDYVIENSTDNIQEAVSAVKSIIVAERCRVRPREIIIY